MMRGNFSEKESMKNDDDDDQRLIIDFPKLYLLFWKLSLDETKGK